METAGKGWLETVFRAAVAAVEPGRLVREALRADEAGLRIRGDAAVESVPWAGVRNVYLVGGGKAGRPMGEAALAILGDRVAAGILAVPAGEEGAAGPVRFLGAGHPLPDEGSREAARGILSLLAGTDARDLVIALVSGGGSSMISSPAEGISPEEKASVSRLLLRSGADIVSLNTVRKHLSAVKGGRLAAACPAAVRVLLLSDVPGDDPSVVASGPFSPDPSTFGDALRVLDGLPPGSVVPPSVRFRVEQGAAGRIPETPKAQDPAFGRVRTFLVGSNRTALSAAAEAAKASGAEVKVLPGFLAGEARSCARGFVAALRNASAAAGPGKRVVLVAGGETSVTVRGNGLGGRNLEFALAAAIEMDGERGMALLCGGTDGVDGPTDAAGAYADGTTCSRARQAGLSPERHLERNDAHSFFRALSGLLRTGPTGTNVADVAVGIALDPAP